MDLTRRGLQWRSDEAREIKKQSQATVRSRSCGERGREEEEEEIRTAGEEIEFENKWIHK